MFDKALVTFVCVVLGGALDAGLYPKVLQDVPFPFDLLIIIFLTAGEIWALLRISKS